MPRTYAAKEHISRRSDRAQRHARIGANLALHHPRVITARAILFGAWQGNGLACDTAPEISLPGSAWPPLGSHESADGNGGD